MSEKDTAVQKSDEQADGDKSSESCHRNSKQLSTFNCLLATIASLVLLTCCLGCKPPRFHKNRFRWGSSPSYRLFLFLLMVNRYCLKAVVTKNIPNAPSIVLIRITTAFTAICLKNLMSYCMAHAIRPPPPVLHFQSFRFRQTGPVIMRILRLR